MIPEWLPRQLAFSGNDINNDYEKLHKIFKRDFIDSSSVSIDGLVVVVDSSIDPLSSAGYTRGFMHLVTIGVDSRSIDYDRASKLPWVRAVLENYLQPEITAFWAPHQKGETLYLWLVDYDFVVILRKQKSVSYINRSIIVTAYHVDRHGKKSLQKTYGKATRVLQ